MSTINPPLDTFVSVYANVPNYGRTKSRAYRNWLQAKQFWYWHKISGCIRRNVAILRYNKGLGIPAWFKPAAEHTRCIPPCRVNKVKEHSIKLRSLSWLSLHSVEHTAS